MKKFLNLIFALLLSSTMPIFALKNGEEKPNKGERGGVIKDLVDNLSVLVKKVDAFTQNLEIMKQDITTIRERTLKQNKLQEVMNNEIYEIKEIVVKQDQFQERMMEKLGGRAGVEKMAESVAAANAKIAEKK